MEPFDLVRWRKARKLTQQALGDMLGVSRRTVNAWEAGQGLPGDMAERLLPFGQPIDPHAPVTSPIVPKWITPRTAPHLYKKVGAEQYTWKPEHPVMLLGYACRDAEGKVPWEVLASDAYQVRLAAYRSSEQIQRPAAGEYGLPRQEYWDKLNED